MALGNFRNNFSRDAYHVPADRFNACIAYKPVSLLFNLYFKSLNCFSHLMMSLETARKHDDEMFTSFLKQMLAT
jgi:hypothetical protein